MVFFTCNNCGTSLKKNQVEKHSYNCRESAGISCMDCSKDFWANDYHLHVKCISEEEKYSSKDFKPKANINKAERQQEQWKRKIEMAAKTPDLDKKTKHTLELLLDYPNVPRTLSKFENFCRNGPAKNEPAIIKRAFELISSISIDHDKLQNENEQESLKPEERNKNGDEASVKKKKNRKRQRGDGSLDNSEIVEKAKKKSKSDESTPKQNGDIIASKRKSKKRKHSDALNLSGEVKNIGQLDEKDTKVSENTEIVVDHDVEKEAAAATKRKSKKKRKHSGALDIAEITTNNEADEDKLNKNKKNAEEMNASSKSAEDNAIDVEVEVETRQNKSKKKKQHSDATDGNTSIIEISTNNEADEDKVKRKKENKEKTITESTKADDIEIEMEVETVKTKSKKKRRRSNTTETDVTVVDSVINTAKEEEKVNEFNTEKSNGTTEVVVAKSKSKKNQKSAITRNVNVAIEELNTNESNTVVAAECNENDNASRKFQWVDVIRSILEVAEDKQLKFKALNKKIAAEYISCLNEPPKSKDEITEKLKKILKKKSIFVYENNLVKLNS